MYVNSLVPYAATMLSDYSGDQKLPGGTGNGGGGGRDAQEGTGESGGGRR